MGEINRYYTDFDALLTIIRQAKQKAVQQVNTTLIDLYWEIGKTISQKVGKEKWGKGVVESLANYIKQNDPISKGFSDKNLWRMKQFYETYKENKKLSALTREIPWTHNTLIFSRCKTPEEQAFYLKDCITHKYTSRALDRQITTLHYQRSIQRPKLSPMLRESHPTANQLFKDNYALEFLGLPEPYNESELQKAIVQNMKQFILEIGTDFIFLSEEYKLQVGNQDFYIDLLFYHRELMALVAFELKISTFKPEHLGQLNFYLEALDRDVKKPHENPSIGILMCSNKDDEVVEYALSRSLSPTLVSQYQLSLPDKKLLENKLQEIIGEFPNTK